jgi:hypothetical protein
MGLNVYLRCEATPRLRHDKNNRCLRETFEAQKYSAGTKCTALTLSLLMLHICGVSTMFGEWYQKTNKTDYVSQLSWLRYCDPGEISCKIEYPERECSHPDSRI